MKVSIITISFNSIAHVEDTIKSVLSQDYPDIEYIVVDGGSTDGTLEVIRKYESRLARFVSEPDRGISDAMNKGIAMATGDVVGIIHSDDYYLPGVVRMVVQRFVDNPGVGVVHGDILMEREGGARDLHRPSPDVQGAITRGMPVQHPSCFVRRALYDAHGGFSLNCKYAMDYDLIARLVRAGVQFHYTALPHAVMRVGGASDTGIRRAFAEARDISVRAGAGRMRAWMTYAFKVSERTAGDMLRRTGLGRIADLYVKIAHRRVNRGNG